MIKISIGLPRPSEGPEFSSVAALTEIARTIEESGLGGCHVPDHPAPVVKNSGHPRHSLDPFVTLAYIGAVTSRIRLQTATVILPYRNPLLTAEMTASLQHVCGGRLVLGVAAGYLRSESAALGADYDERNELMDEAIETMRTAWQGAPMWQRGRHWDAAGNSIVQVASTSPPQVWVGGNSVAAMERAARLGDGWMPMESDAADARSLATASITSLDELEGRIGRVMARRQNYGMTGSFDICYYRKISWLSLPEPQILSDIRTLERIGVTWVAGRLMTTVMRSRGEFLERIRRLGAAVSERK